MLAWNDVPSATGAVLDNPEEKDFEEDEEFADEDFDEEDEDDDADPYEEYDDLADDVERRHHPRREEWDG